MTVKEYIEHGTIFHQLTYLHDVDKKPNRHALFLCQCGTEKVIRISHVKCGSIASCGCNKHEKGIVRYVKHGYTNTRIYNMWKKMKQRCLHTIANNYKDYGGRGITICDRWLIFDNFLSDMGEPPIGMSIDRIDNNGNYEPSNCRWASVKEQANNRRSNVLLDYNNKIQTLAQWADEIGINKDTIYSRRREGKRLPDDLLKR